MYANQFLCGLQQNEIRYLDGLAQIDTAGQHYIDFNNAHKQYHMCVQVSYGLMAVAAPGILPPKMPNGPLERKHHIDGVFNYVPHTRLHIRRPCTVTIAELWKKIYHPSYGLLNGFLGMLGLESWQREWLGDTETALIAVFIPIVWQYIGNHMLMMYSAIKGVPNELLEAACIDGASYLQTCFLVTIPMIKDMIIVCVTFAIVGSLKVFDLVYVMTNGGPLHATEVPGTLMYSAIFQKNQYGYGSAIAVFIVLECVLFTFASRWLMNRAFGDDRETKTSRRKGGR